MTTRSRKYVCSVCQNFAASSFDSVLRHIGSIHSCEPNLHLTCGIEGCPRTYTSYRSYRKHLFKKHQEFVETSQASDEQPLNGFDLNDDEPSPPPSDGRLQALTTPKHAAALFLLKAKEGHRLSQTALDGVVGDFSEFLTTTVSAFGDAVKECLKDSTVGVETMSRIDNIFHDYKTPFEGLETSYLQQKYYTEFFNFVEPVERKLGQHVRRFTKNNTSHTKLTWDVVYDVPLISSLQQMLSDDHILEEVLCGHSRKDDIMEDYCDGPQFKEHPLFSSEPHSLQIMLYFDEVEVCNPLGSSAKIHKLGFFYYQLGNMSPQYRSSLKGIQLVAVANSSVIVKYGSNKILEPFKADLRKLEHDDGVDFHLHDKYTFRGTLTLVSGDNLGSNFIGGYKQLSSALRKCRFCMAVAGDMREKFFAEDFQPRTRETHALHCRSLGGPLHDHIATTYGLYHDSILNTSRFYHVTEGLPPDIMHDILEGSLQYEVKELLKYLIKEKGLAIDTLNTRIELFPYVHPDKNNKPSPISMDTLKCSHHSLKQTASKMWCLGRLLPLIIGDLVPEGDEKWELFLQLLTIIDYVFAPKTTSEIVAYVRLLIKYHHTKFTSLYPDCSVLPKMHYMVHIPLWMERCGPMTRYWCMRYEAKHSYFKDIAQKTKCFKNIPKSLAERHQRLVCYHFHGSKALVKEFKTGKVFENSVDSLPYSDVLAESATITATKVHRTKWIQVQGSHYVVGCVVVLNTEPVFGQVIDILLTEVDICLFVCEVLTINRYVEHYHAFEVSREVPTPVVFCSQKDLSDFHALGLYKVNQAQYVVPKYYVED